MRCSLHLLLLLFFSAHTVVLCDDDKPDAEVEEEDDSVKPAEKLNFVPPKSASDAHFRLYFTSPNDLSESLVVSEAKKDGVEESLSKYDGVWAVEVPESGAILGDYALVLKSKAKHHAVSAHLKRPFRFEGKQFVIQYEVKFQNGLECGGAYVKLLTDSPDLNLKLFNDKTPYTIMFGPDKCGMDYKLHFIFRHKNPNTGEYEEKHSKKPKGELEKYFTDKKTHLFTLVVNADNMFEIYVDQVLVNSGNLLEDFTPPVNPSREIDDPTDKKPEDWDDRAKIQDTTATKPEDWDETQPEFVLDTETAKPEGWLDDEPLTVPDSTAEKPKDWDNEIDGEWEPPKVDNPKCKDAPGCGEWKPPKVKNLKYKGKWSAPMIDNPQYKGIWKPRRIDNPNYFEDLHPFHMTPFSAIGLELWSMTDQIAFDNFIIADSKQMADDFAAETFDVKKDAERRADPSSQSVVDAIRDATHERPWLWAVIILVIGLPIVLISVYCCCMRGDSGSARGRAAADAKRKKTDEPAEDDEAEDDEEEEEGEGEAEGEAEGTIPAPAKDTEPSTAAKKQKEKGGGRAALEKDSSDEEGESEKEGAHRGHESGDSAEKAAEDDAAEKSGEEPKQSPRKRHVRKE